MYNSVVKPEKVYCIPYSDPQHNLKTERKTNPKSEVAHCVVGHYKGYNRLHLLLDPVANVNRITITGVRGTSISAERNAIRLTSIRQNASLSYLFGCVL